MRKTRFLKVLALTLVFVMVMASVASAGTRISNTLKATFTVVDPTVRKVETADELGSALSDGNVTTINLASGTYCGQFIISRNVTINGMPDGTSIIAPSITLSETFSRTVDEKTFRPIVLVNKDAVVEINNVVVDGQKQGASFPGFVGIGVHNASGTLNNVKVRNIRNEPLSGVQYGVGIEAWNDENKTNILNINNSVVDEYQKGGICLEGEGLTVNVGNNTVTGAGSTPITAQNGIQISRGAVGKITNNTVSNNMCTTSGWEGSGTGVLIYDTTTTSITAVDNIYSGNDRNFHVYDKPIPVILTGTINEKDFDDEDELKITVDNIRENNIIVINAVVDGLQEFYNAKLFLDLGDNANKASVKIGEASVTAVNGVFDIGAVLNQSDTQTYTVTISFIEIGTYEAEIYVVEGNK